MLSSSTDCPKPKRARMRLKVEHLRRIRNVGRMGSNVPRTDDKVTPSATSSPQTTYHDAARRCLWENMMRGRNHRPGDNRALDYASVLSILVSSFVVVSLLLNRSTFESAVAAWTPISIGRATLCRTVPVYPPNSVEIRDNGLDTSHRFSLLQASNINGNNIEDVAPQSPSSLLSPLPTPFIPSSSCKVDQMSGTDLAYIGDVVYELFIRTRTVWPLKRTSDLQHQVVTLVRGTIQSIFFYLPIDKW